MAIPAEPEKTVFRSVLIAVILFLLILAMPATLIALLLLLKAETWNGRLFAIFCILVYAGTWGFFLWLTKGNRAVARGTLALYGLALITFVACGAPSPHGVTPNGSKLQSVF